MGKVSGGAGRNRPAGFMVAARRTGVASGGNPDQAQAILAEVQRMQRAGLLRTVTRADEQRAQDRAAAADVARQALQRQPDRGSANGRRALALWGIDVGKPPVPLLPP